MTKFSNKPKNKINSNFLVDYILDLTEKIAKRFYFTILVKKDLFVPVLACEIHISRTGWEHTFESPRRLKKSEKLFRFFVLPKIIPLLQAENIKPKYEIGRDPKDKVEFWSFLGIVDNARIKVVIRSVNDGPKHLFSMVWKGEVFENKKKLSGACIPRVRGVVTPELQQEQYSIFLKKLSRVSYPQWQIKQDYQGGAVRIGPGSGLP